MKLFEKLQPEVQRLANIYKLVLKGATENEREAARLGFERMSNSVRDKFGQEQANEFIRQAKQTAEKELGGSQSYSSSSSTKSKSYTTTPRWKLGDRILFSNGEVKKVVGVDREGESYVLKDIITGKISHGRWSMQNVYRKATQEDIDRYTAKKSSKNATGWVVSYLLALVDPVNNHDKVWGIATNDDKDYVKVFWGRNGKTLRYKNDERFNAHKTMAAKEKKGYRQTTNSNQIEWVEKQLSMLTENSYLTAMPVRALFDNALFDKDSPEYRELERRARDGTGKIRDLAVKALKRINT